jgi:hypothetical protein
MCARFLNSALVAFFVFDLIHGVSSTRLRINTRHATEQNSVLVRVTKFDTMSVHDDGKMGRQKQARCIPIVNGKESDQDYSCNIPDDLLEEYRDKIGKGKLLMNIVHAAIINDELFIGNGAQYDVLLEDEHLRHLTERHLQTTGELTVSVLRISTSDSSPKDSLSTLKSTLFESEINFVNQYRDCSSGKLQWKLSSFGVQDVQLPNSIGEFGSADALVTAVQKFMKSNMGLAAVSDLSDKVIMCLPPGTGSWAASAGVGHWRAQFNSDWCTSLSGTVHELGHTLGLEHANADGQEYADRTGYMGSGNTKSDWPRKCFNGHNSNFFGWYNDKTLVWDPVSQGDKLVTLATFVDYDKASANEPVIVTLSDQFYIQYNRQKDFNIDTEQKQDQVTVTSRPDSMGTWSLAGLSPGNAWTVDDYMSSGKTLIVNACRTLTTSGGADAMELSIAFNTDLCGSVATPSQEEPVPSSTSAPDNNSSTAATSDRRKFIEWLKVLMEKSKSQSP